MLASATRALAARDATAALAHVDEHAARFPAGVLAEEREALRIEALLLANRTADARAAADAFRRRYPDTLHYRLIERATRAPKEPSP